MRQRANRAGSTWPAAWRSAGAAASHQASGRLFVPDRPWFEHGQRRPPHGLSGLPRHIPDDRFAGGRAAVQADHQVRRGAGMRLPLEHSGAFQDLVSGCGEQPQLPQQVEDGVARAVMAAMQQRLARLFARVRWISASLYGTPACSNGWRIRVHRRDVWVERFHRSVPGIRGSSGCRRHTRLSGMRFLRATSLNELGFTRHTEPGFLLRSLPGQAGCAAAAAGRCGPGRSRAGTGRQSA